MRNSILLAISLVAPIYAVAASAGPEAPERPLLGYIRDVPAELTADREARLRRIAARRAGTVIMVHRGASAFAPENTLEAYAAAMDYGADGCEIDVRRTVDGVLVLFHDDMLDRLTEGFGTVDSVTYYELLSFRPRFVYGAARDDTRAPTLAALLVLARQRAMLLHLDIKEPGLEAAIADLLDAAGTWEHIVAVNAANAPNLSRDPRLRLLRYKGAGLHEERRDMDPKSVRDQLARAGDMIMVDDPRVAAFEREDGRWKTEDGAGRPFETEDGRRKTEDRAGRTFETEDGRRKTEDGRGLRERWPVRHAEGAPTRAGVRPAEHLRRRAAITRPDSEKELRVLLASGSLQERGDPDGSPEYERRRTERILDRAWAAQRLGHVGRRRGGRRPDAALVRLLVEQLRTRSLHRDWMYHGLDGAMAARALGMLGATDAAPELIQAFLRVDPELRRVVDPRFAANPLAWTDFRTKMSILPALGELRCPASKAFLKEYAGWEEARAREVAPVLHEEATRALMRQKLDAAEIESLLRSRHTGVRGAALLECLDHPNKARRAALKAAAPWALELPRAGKAHH